MIICAALLIQIEDCDHETIIPCHRHGDGFKILKDFHANATVISQGFIDHKGVFLNRRAALEHAIDCGQLCATAEFYLLGHRIDELDSEDLY